LTRRLAEALKAHQHLRGPRVVCQDDGTPLTQKVVQGMAHRAARKAGLTKSGVHQLRHAFCSHPAMHGATAKAIQELARHKDLSTTQAYMHLSPAALEHAIRLLDGGRPVAFRGEIVEAEGQVSRGRPLFGPLGRGVRFHHGVSGSDCVRMESDLALIVKTVAGPLASRAGEERGAVSSSVKLCEVDHDRSPFLMADPATNRYRAGRRPPGCLTARTGAGLGNLLR